MMTDEEKATKRPYIVKMLADNHISIADDFSYWAVVQLLLDANYTAHLGVATTGELLEELTARSDLNYRTVEPEYEIPTTPAHNYPTKGFIGLKPRC